METRNRSSEESKVKEDGPVVVIGGGSTGSSTAYNLAKGGIPTVLVDKGPIASGMTSRSSALVRTHYSNEIVARMALYSLRTFEDFSSVGFAGFVNNGMLILASKEEKEGVEANVSMLSGIGVRNEVFSKDEAVRKFPEVNFEGVEYVLYEPESGYADPVSTANSYANKARELGAVLLLGREVTKILSKDDKLAGVELSDGEVLNCSRAIICTNVWTNKLLERSGVDPDRMLPLWSVAHPVIILKRPESYQGVRPSIADFPNKTYYKPEGQSLFFGGSLDPELDKQKVDPDEAPNEVPFEYINFFSEVLSKRMPVMGSGILHSSYVGMYDMTPDQHPIMDSLSGLGFEGLYCCVGLSGHGFKLSPALGLMSSEMVLGKDNSISSFDRSPFALGRFERGRLLTSKYSGVGTVA